MGEAAFGVGAYTPMEAGRLIGVSPAMVRRWLFGYTSRTDQNSKRHSPLWQPQYGLGQDDPLLGFRDLIEARMVAKLRDVGMSLQNIRHCLMTAAEIANDSHPFSSARFRTDGQRLFLERLSDEGGHDVIDLKSRQMAFPKVIERSFLDLDFDDEKATRWFLTKSKQVLADPQRSFGQPIVDEGGIPTYRLAQAYVAEGRSVDKVATLFEISRSAVREALSFESQHGRLKQA